MENMYNIDVLALAVPIKQQPLTTTTTTTTTATTGDDLVFTEQTGERGGGLNRTAPKLSTGKRIEKLVRVYFYFELLM